jgi:serine/threonine protein kinase
MAIDSVSTLVAVLKQSKLLEPNQLQELQALAGAFSDPKLFMRDLIAREWLTPFQANQVFQNGGKDLVLGPYVIMNRLGDGVLGQVYKARHRRMNRLVALKVIRAELLARPEAVERFYQQSQVVSSLSDPHIVHAYDAGPMGQTHFLAMEFVEGVDLDTLVQQSGALPLPVAADFICQAGQGLQHAHERNTPHLDLKPSNLLVTRQLAGAAGPASGSSSWRSLLATAGVGGATVKINNFGLSFLHGSGQTATDPTTLGGSKVATDFASPERFLQGGKPDIRSDLYSLGCIYYYLVAGRVPFPGGTPGDKVRRHQTEEPVPLNLLRKDAAADTMAIIAKMMAKRPQQRFQSPAELVQALGGGRHAPR